MGEKTISDNVPLSKVRMMDWQNLPLRLEAIRVPAYCQLPWQQPSANSLAGLPKRKAFSNLLGVQISAPPHAHVDVFNKKRASFATIPKHKAFSICSAYKFRPRQCTRICIQ